MPFSSTSQFSIGARPAREHGVAELTEVLRAEGLRPWFVRKSEPVDPAEKVKGANNPYDDAFQFKETPAEKEAERQKRMASLIKQGGTRLAASLARAAGKSITGQPLQKIGAARR
jgi:hypothetical protein